MIHCVLCGRCASAAHRVSGDERLAPRNVVWNIQKGRESAIFFQFLLNGETTCPVGVAIEEVVLAARRRLVREGKGLRAHKVFLEQFLAGENPYRITPSLSSSSKHSRTDR